ncbi:MAG: acetyltransferase [Pseudolysinimonas sp.]
MIAENIVLRSDDPRISELLGAGWQVVAQSWGAQLEAGEVDLERLDGLVEHARAAGLVRELEPYDRAAILVLDAGTLGDYPGGIATMHTALDPERATVTESRRRFGVIGPDGRLVAMTFVDVNATHVETDFTVVSKESRGCGLGTAVKAASVIALLREGAERFRTGGSADNAAIVAANTTLGYTIDETWLTLAPPAA